MKKIIVLCFMLIGLSAYSHAASSSNIGQRQYEFFSDTGKETSVVVTLSGVAGTVSTVTVPSNAKGFKLFPRTSNIRFSIGTSTSSTLDGQFASRVLVAIGSTTALNVHSSDFGLGGVAKADLWETRLLPMDGRQRNLYIRSETTFVVVDIEFF